MFAAVPAPEREPAVNWGDFSRTGRAALVFSRGNQM